MALDQTSMNSYAEIVSQVHGLGLDTGEGRFETLTYVERMTLSATPVNHLGIRGLVTQYSEEVIAASLALTSESMRIQRDDQQLRIATSLVTWAPTLTDTVQRSDGTLWRVMDRRGGIGKPFWLMRLRKMEGQG